MSDLNAVILGNFLTKTRDLSRQTNSQLETLKGLMKDAIEYQAYANTDPDNIPELVVLRQSITQNHADMFASFNELIEMVTDYQNQATPEADPQDAVDKYAINTAEISESLLYR